MTVSMRICNNCASWLKAATKFVDMTFTLGWRKGSGDLILMTYIGYGQLLNSSKPCCVTCALRSMGRLDLHGQ
jgi:hypothetical protein